VGGGVLGPPGCGLAAAAFCEDFEAGPHPLSRSGELDPARWSIGRLTPKLPTSSDGAMWIGPSAPITNCRADIDGSIVTPDADALVCESNVDISSRHALISVAAQDYGLNSHRAKQRFDFTNRTGVIALDADLTLDPLYGFLGIALSADPTPAPSFGAFEYSTGPRHGIEVVFDRTCGENTAGIAGIRQFVDHAETYLDAESACVATQAGKLNHVELHVSKGHLTVFASDPGSDIVNPILEVDLALDFERAWVNVTVHNHATIKYEYGPAWTTRFDNFAFDGPVLPTVRESNAANSLLESDGGRFVGYLVNEAASIELDGVDPTGVTTARVALTAWYLTLEGDPTSFTLSHRMNGGALRSHTLTPGEVAALLADDQQGALNHILEIDPADLIAGKNVLSIQAVNVPETYPPAIANVDLLLE
jgi:hypothetical protein